MDEARRIEIRGKFYPIRVTMGAMVRFKRETGCDVSELKDTDLERLLVFMWCCVVSACKADDVDFGMDFETFADCIDIPAMMKFSSSLEAKKKKVATVTKP